MLALLTNYLVCELPGVLARRPGAVSVGLIDQDLHPASRVRPLGIKHSQMSERWVKGSLSQTLDSWLDFLAIM